MIAKVLVDASRSTTMNFPAKLSIRRANSNPAANVLRYDCSLRLFSEALAKSASGREHLRSPLRTLSAKTDEAAIQVLRQVRVSDSASSEQFVEADLCGQYQFTEAQLQRFHKLYVTLKQSATGFVAVAVATLALSFLPEVGENIHEIHEQVEGGGAAAFFNALSLGGVSRPVDSLLMAGLLNYCAQPFENVLQTDSRQLAHAFQGIDRLSLVFQQLAIASLAVATVTMLDAAVKWPQIATIASVIFFIFAVTRSAAMWWVLTAHAAKLDDVETTLAAYRGCGDSRLAEMCPLEMPLWDRLAVGLAFGYLVQYEPPNSSARQAVLISGYSDAESADEPLDCSLPQYAFNTSEQKLLRVCMDSANTAGLALALQGLATSLSGVANYFSGDSAEAVSDGINAGHKLLLAFFIASASTTFDRILYTEGCDIGHLMQGIGKKGLTSLFQNLGVLAWTVTVAHAFTLALPWIEHSPFFTLAAEKTSHEMVHAVLTAQKFVLKFVR